MRIKLMLVDRVITRRYHADGQGRSILIGLSYDETREFEALEQTSPADEDGNPFWMVEGLPRNDAERRWLELYLKHQAAWESWRSETQAFVPLISDAAE